MFQRKLATYVLMAAAAGSVLMAADEAKKVRVGAAVQAANILSQTRPVYPADAKANRIQGTVVLNVDIGTDGKVERLNVESGPDVLTQAAVEAVQQWTYRPTLLNGEPVEVTTTVNVNFTLSQ